MSILEREPRKRAAEELSLVEPTLELEDSFVELAQECRSNGELRFNEALADFPGYVANLQAAKRGESYIPGRVPVTTYWLVRDGEDVLGVATLRHRLTHALLKEGGHIGYTIRPSERRKGYGKSILALTLDKAREHGFDKVLVTCDTDNIASAKIIQSNGGVFEDEVISDRTGKPVSRYWIEL